MAVIVVPPTDLAQNTASIALGNGTLITHADGFSVDTTGYGNRAIILVVTDGSGAHAVTITAGQDPNTANPNSGPAIRAGLGDLTFTMGASEQKAITVDSSRFLQSDMKIKGTIAGTTSRVLALVAPTAF